MASPGGGRGLRPFASLSRRGPSLASLLTLPNLVLGTVPVVAQAFIQDGPDLRLSAGLGAGVALAIVISHISARRLQKPLAALTQALESGRRAAGRPSPPQIRELAGVSKTLQSVSEDFESITARLMHKAFHDPLTGLPNRALFMERLEKALLRSEAPVAVLFIDLDRFKVVNDTLGHEVGDGLLVGFTDRVRTTVSPKSTFARLGGDEFVLMVRGSDAEQDGVAIAREIRARLEAPLMVLGRELFVSASIGVASSAGCGTNSTEVLRRADTALYRAKSEGRARIASYDPSLDSMPVERLDLETALRRALIQGELALHFQPQCDLRTGDVVGVEALLRWNHPHRGVLSPADFISLAEETGDILPIGQWVLLAACEKASQLARDFPRADGEPLAMAVNLSAAEFRQPRLVENLSRILAATGVPPASLCLEITESTLMESLPETMETLAALKQLGVRIAMDDFGTGYSSLSYLQRLPVDVLKIDCAFVRSLGTDRRSLPIVKAIVELAAALELDVIAEGIETKGQLKILRTVGCGTGQGYLFGAAFASENIKDFIYQAGLARELVA